MSRSVEPEAAPVRQSSVAPSEPSRKSPEQSANEKEAESVKIEDQSETGVEQSEQPASIRAISPADSARASEAAPQVEPQPIPKMSIKPREAPSVSPPPASQHSEVDDEVEEEEGDGTRYVPEKIIAERQNSAGVIDLLVQWADYPNEDDWTWEPYSDLFEDVPALVEAWESGEKPETNAVYGGPQQDEEETKQPKVMKKGIARPVEKKMKDGRGKGGKKRKREEVEEVDEVDELLQKKGQKGKVFYLVKWKGYEKVSDRTWEPEITLKADVPELVAEFEVKAQSAQKVGIKKSNGVEDQGEKRGRGRPKKVAVEEVVKEPVKKPNAKEVIKKGLKRATKEVGEVVKKQSSKREVAKEEKAPRGRGRPPKRAKTAS